MIPLANRLKAARALGGFSTAADLARAVETPGLAEKTLRRFEQGKGDPSTDQLSAIAAACGLRKDFFEMQVEREATPGPSVSARVKAARALAEMTVEELATAIGSRGLGVGPLKAIEQGRRDAAPHELVAIARACRVPTTFFDGAFFRAEAENPDVRRLEEKLNTLMAHLGAGAVR